MHLHLPIPELGTAENILRMLRPTGEFDPLEARVLDLTLILQAEHGGGNNSAFTTYLLSSSATDTYSVLSAAVGSLKGPRHGGANIAVIRMIDDLKANVHVLLYHNKLRYTNSLYWEIRRRVSGSFSSITPRESVTRPSELKYFSILVTTSLAVPR